MELSPLKSLDEFVGDTNHRLVKLFLPLEVVLECAFAANRLADASGLDRAVVNASGKVVQDGPQLAKSLGQVRQ